MPFDHEQFGKWRGTIGLSQRQVASQLGVSNQTVNDWERGFHQPTLAHLDKIAMMAQNTPGFEGCSFYAPPPPATM